MAGGYASQGTWTPDVREWEAWQRRQASLAVLGVAAVSLLAAVVFYVLGGTAAVWTVTVVLVALIVLLLVEAVIVATGVATETGSGPTWLRAGTAATAGQAMHAGGPPADEDEARPVAEIDLRCPECGGTFTEQDTGERPLPIQCPHCGVQGKADIGAEPETHAHTEDDIAERDAPVSGGIGDEPLPGLEDEPAEDLPVVTLKCPACDTRFETEDTGERPLKTTCSGCGRKGKLR